MDTWISSSVVISEILVHPSPKQCTLYPVCTLLFLTPPPNLPRHIPKIHYVILMPLPPHSLAPSYIKAKSYDIWFFIPGLLHLE